MKLLEAAFVSLLLGLPAPCAACSCVGAPFGKPWEQFGSAKYVYLARASALDSDSWRLLALRVWKGSQREYTLQSTGGCGYYLKEGEYYLMYAGADPQIISQCGSQPIPVCAALEDIAWLDKNRGLPPTVVPGVDCKPSKKVQ